LYTVIRYVSNSAKLGIFTFVGLNETLVEAKIRTKGFFSFDKCPS
jgi:hypothetical protein